MHFHSRSPTVETRQHPLCFNATSCLMLSFLLLILLFRDYRNLVCLWCGLFVSSLASILHGMRCDCGIMCHVDVDGSDGGLASVHCVSSRVYHLTVGQVPGSATGEIFFCLFLVLYFFVLMMSYVICVDGVDGGLAPVYRVLYHLAMCEISMRATGVNYLCFTLPFSRRSFVHVWAFRTSYHKAFRRSLCVLWTEACVCMRAVCVCVPVCI